MSTQVSPEQTRIGWIGTGVMGRSMCGHLLAAGYKVTLFTRTKTKAAELIERGAAWAASPREVAAASDVVISIVGFPSDVRQVLLGEDGALAGCKAWEYSCRHDDERAIARRGNRRTRRKVQCD